jgi:iron-sulfur cluster assembly protein
MLPLNISFVQILFGVLFMIEITKEAADMLKSKVVEDKVIRMFLAAVDPSGANYGMTLGDAEKDDVIFESRGIKIHMEPKDAELLAETIIDYVDDDRGTGFIIRGPEDELSGCSSCGNADTCDHDHDSCDHDHGGCDHDHGGGCGCS